MSLLEKTKQYIGDANTRVLRGIILVSVFLVIGKMAGVFKEMAIAHRDGVGTTVDTYVFVFVLVSWIPVIFQSIGQSVLVPLLKRLDEIQREIFFSELVRATFVFGLFLTAGLYYFAGDLIGFFASELDGELQVVTIEFARTIAPGALFLLLVTVYSAELLSREQHANTLVEVFPALVMLFCVFWWPSNRPGLEPYALGVLLGLVLQFVVLHFISHMKLSVIFQFGYFRHYAWREVGAAMSILALGSVFIGLAKPLDMVLAARFGEGSVSQLSYALRILALIIGLGTTVLTRALLPVLSDSSHSLEVKVKLARQWTVLTLIFGFVCVLFAWVFSPVVVRLLFERGAFTQEDTILVSSIVKYGLVQIPFVMAGMVLVQLFAGLGEYRIIALSGVFGATVKVITIIPLSSFFDLNGIMLSNGMMYASTFGYFVWRYSRLLSKLS